MDFNPITSSVISKWNFAVSGVERFILHKDRVFYTIDGSTILSQVFNAGAMDKAGVGEITSIRNPADSSVDFSGTTLYDFQDWVDFEYNSERFKLVWSVQTGYFLLNASNRLVGHLYGNFTPYLRSELTRMRYLGGAIQDDSQPSKVFIPILRSGQPEVVNREAITDRVVRGGQELVVFRPLGVELLEIDFSDLNIPQVETINQNTLLSGPVLSWTEGQGVSEYSFAEKPQISKVDDDDYDRWPYSDLDFNVPAIGTLERDQYTEVEVNLGLKISPYLVEEVRFTASTSSGNIGANADSDWDSDEINRTLRFATNSETGGISDSYQGILDKVYYDSTEKALITEFRSAPATLDDPKTHPQAIYLNGIRYDYHYLNVESGVLKAYHFVDSSPVVSGTDYEVIMPRARVEASTNAPQVVQRPNTDNGNTEIRLDEVSLRSFLRRRVGIVTQLDEILNTATLRFGYLNQFRDRGAIETAIRTLAGVRANVEPQVPPPVTTSVTTLRRSSSDDITIEPQATFSELLDREIVSFWRFGNLIWSIYYDSNLSRYYMEVARFQDDLDNRIRIGQNAYRVQGSSISRVRGENRVFFPYQSGSNYQNPFRIGNTLWVRNVGNQASNNSANWQAYDYSNVLTRNSSKDFSISGVKQAPFVIDNTLWVQTGSDNALKAYDYSNGRFTYNSSKNLTKSSDTGVVTAAYKISESSKIVWLKGTASTLRAYEFSGSSWLRKITFDFTPSRTLNVNSFHHGNKLYTFSSPNIRGGGRDSGGRYPISQAYVSQTTSRTTQPQAPQIVSVSDGSITSGAIAEGISVAGLWVQGSKLFIVFKSLKTTFATSRSLDIRIKTLLKGWAFNLGDNSYFYTFPESPTKFEFNDTNNVYVRYEVKGFNTNQALKDIVNDDSLLLASSLSVPFTQKRIVSYHELDTTLEPSVFSAKYSGFDENGMAKVLTADQINENLILFTFFNRQITDSFFLTERTFQKIKGAVSTNNYYYMATQDNPLNVNREVFDEERIILRYPLIEVRPEVSARQVLTAQVYNYKCQFKWLDEAGLEHRSQFSDIIQIVSNSPIGGVGNQPKFSVNHLNLTNKAQASVAVDIYRTKNKSRTFQLLKEVVSLKVSQQTEITDDVEDDRLGAPAGPDIVLVSGAKHVSSYKGRFVLYGFPDKPNRVLVSSPYQPFSNFASSFRNSNLPGDSIEILMQQDVVKVIAMDSYLIIFCKDQTFVWSVVENSLRQKEPQPVSGLSHLTAQSFRSSIDTTEGVMFEASNNQGMHLITRGLQWSNIGLPIKDVTSGGELVDSAIDPKSEDVLVLRSDNSNDFEQPKILVYSQRFKIWTSLSNRDWISAVPWEGKLAILTESGEIFQSEEEGVGTRVFEVETGWISFSGAFMNFQRLRDIYLLMEAGGLAGLQLVLDFDFIEGESQETINFNLARATTSFGGSQIPLESKKEWRFQPRKQKCSSVKIKIRAIAQSVKFDAIRFGVDAGPAISGQSHQKSSI